MTIKNETAFTKECMEGAMRASNFDNSKTAMGYNPVQTEEGQFLGKRKCLV